MSRKFLTALDLVQNELQNARIQNLAAAPTSPAPVKGQVYFNTGDNTLYWYDGTVWQSSKQLAIAYGAVAPETAAFGSASTDGVATTVARSDHKHGNPTIPFAAVAPETAAFGTASADGVSSSVARSDHKHGNPAHDASAHAAIPLSALAPAQGDINMNLNKITGLSNNPTTGTDAVNKNYVDGVAQGLDAKASCYVATLANITLSGTQSIDGLPVVVGDRVLVKNQTNPAQNGVYVVASGAWARASDMNVWTEVPGAFVFVESGTAQAATGWVCTSPQGGTIDSTAVNWTQFSGAGAYTAGTGLTQSGTTFNVGAGLGITVNADDVAVTWAGTGAANTSARSDHNHAATTKFAANVGGSTSQVLNHALNTRDVAVTVYRNGTPWDTVECDVERTDVNNVTLRFTVAPAASEYRAVVAA